MKWLSVAAITALLISGCASATTIDPISAASEAGSAPLNFRQDIIEEVKKTYFDPYSIRSAEITQPFMQKHITLGHFWAVCVRANAKNRMGGYIGVETEAYVFRNGALLQKSWHPETYCGSVVYEPFPEMEQII